MTITYALFTHTYMHTKTAFPLPWKTWNTWKNEKMISSSGKNMEFCNFIKNPGKYRESWKTPNVPTLYTSFGLHFMFM